MAFRDGILVFRQSGALPPAGLEQVIEGIKALDMDDVRRQVAGAAGRRRSRPDPREPTTGTPARGAGRARVRTSLGYRPGIFGRRHRPAGGPGMELNPDEMQTVVKRLGAPRARSAAC